MASSPPVNALLRGLQVLEAVNTHGPVGLSVLWRQTGLPKATVLRLLESLRHAGYVSFHDKDQTYSVSLRVLALSNNVSHEQQLLEMARPIMARLREKLGWPSDLAVFQHNQMVIVDTNRSPGTLSTNRRIGSRVPMMASATGRIYLANLPEEERLLLLDNLAESSDAFEQLAKDRDAACRMLDQTLARGYGLSDQEFLETNRGAAVAVLRDGHVLCVINLIAIASLVSLEEVETRYVPMLIEAKTEFERQLRQLPPFGPRQALRVLRRSSDGKQSTVWKDT